MVCNTCPTLKAKLQKCWFMRDFPLPGYLKQVYHVAAFRFRKPRHWHQLLEVQNMGRPWWWKSQSPLFWLTTTNKEIMWLYNTIINHPPNYHVYRWYVYYSQMGALWHCFNPIPSFISNFSAKTFGSGGVAASKSWVAMKCKEERKREREREEKNATLW